MPSTELDLADIATIELESSEVAFVFIKDPLTAATVPGVQQTFKLMSKGHRDTI